MSQFVLDSSVALKWYIAEVDSQLAVTYRRSVYDSLYLALSLRSNCRFVTADERLVNAVGTALPNVISLQNWPEST